MLKNAKLHFLVEWICFFKINNETFEKCNKYLNKGHIGADIVHFPGLPDTLPKRFFLGLWLVSLNKSFVLIGQQSSDDLNKVIYYHLVFKIVLRNNEHVPSKLVP